jgi:hypothetical protein
MIVDSMDIREIVQTWQELKDRKDQYEHKVQHKKLGNIFDDLSHFENQMKGLNADIKVIQRSLTEKEIDPKRKINEKTFLPNLFFMSTKEH